MMFLVYFKEAPYSYSRPSTFNMLLVYAQTFDGACEKITALYPGANSFQNLTLL